ncbi:uncharacterized protein [Atheta coriaria]|uniref:uncharacterized protein n=1 Tax=Dalotia coriaria TaxID=877792 RepID=UPI0031F39594
MNELKGRFVNIVLSVEEGRGFDLVKCPFYVTASFHGRKMDSDIVEGANVVFNTEMVWETEKKLLRKVRGSYSNIRLECFTSEGKLLGFTLVCLRSAKIVPMSKVNLTEINPIWTKLVSVPNEIRKSTPELAVFLLIRDFVPNMPPNSPLQKIYPSPDLPELPSLQFQQIRVPVKYSEEGYIQLGNPEDCKLKFQLKLTLLIGYDLDVIMPESIIFGNTSKTFHLSVEIFGLEVKTRKISENVYAPMVIFNESIVINLMLSHYDLLGTYFQQYPVIKVKFNIENDMLAVADIDMKQLNLDLPEVIFNECKRRFEMEQVCFFDGYYRASCSTQEMRRATISVKCVLEGVDSFENKQQETTSNEATICGPNEINSPMNQAGDGLVSGPVELSLTHRPQSFYLSSDSNSTINSDDLRDHIEHYQQLLLEMKVESIMWKAVLSSRRFIFKLMHPTINSALGKEIEIDTYPHKEIRIKGVECNVSMVALNSRINYMIVNYTPKLELYDAEEQALIGSMGTIDFTRFHINKSGPPYDVMLLAPSGQEIGTLYITVMANVMSDVLAEPPALFHLSPTILDETIIMHTLDELNDWQIKKCEEIEATLDAQKELEMKRLSAEFRTKTLPLQEDLLKNLEKCRTLVKRQEKRKQLDTIDLEVTNLMKTQEYSIIMEIHKNTIKFQLSDKQELIEIISELELKHTILREMLSEQSLQMQELKETQLTAEQTKILLTDLRAMEQKCEIAQQDKNYFKKEYEKAMKEVHNLKLDHHRNIASKIHNDKQALNILVTLPALNNNAKPSRGPGTKPLTKTKSASNPPYRAGSRPVSRRSARGDDTKPKTSDDQTNKEV